MKQLTVNKFLRLLFLQILLGLSFFLGACSSLNDTISETDLTQEEYTEVNIAIREGEEMVFYDEDAFSLKYPERSEVLNSMKSQFLADTITTQGLFGIGCVYDDSYGWVLVCANDWGYCYASGTSESIDKVSCYGNSSRSKEVFDLEELVLENTSELQLALLPAVQMAREAPRKQR